MKISVIVTSYNQKKYLIKTLDSILAQTLKPFEIIVCDDFSKDGSREFIKSLQISYPEMIKTVFQKKNLGVTRNRNSGIKLAKGDFISTLDGDDLYLPQKLEKELKTALQKNAPLVYSNVIYIDENGKKKGLRYKNNRLKQGFLFEKIATLRYPAPREVLIAKSCIKTMGYQDQAFDINEDFEWIVRFSSRYPFAAVKEPLVLHRHHPKGLSQTNRLLLLETQALVVQKMIWLTNKSMVKNPGETIKKLTSFLHLTMARIEQFKGNTAMAEKYLAKSMSRDFLRSANYDLLMRLFFPKIFKKPSRLPDSLMVGPLALPFYFARGVF